ncbi:MAG: porphobilinogen synthase [Candidatus Thermoplasmatota archaeon]|nr:porphobilinogen synthase [Candidatus Thermoplasmatota archaeon]MCL6015255.1 porphobilinogen synthase [Candidatus Thermoplasmatota archaeon]
MFPEYRPRRLRANPLLRSLTGETKISLDRLIMPVFIDENLTEPQEIPSLPSIFTQTLDSVDEYAKHLKKIGVNTVLLFGIPEKKDSEGSQSFADDGVIQRSIKSFRNNDLLVVTDLCMCEYTDHGHCGILRGKEVWNDKTLDYYGKIAVSQAEAGSNIIAPSGMMDGQVKKIRNELDGNGFENIPIMAYSAKYASSLYGPFRDAAKSTPSFGDRKTYQMDPANINEAMREIELDIEEGADIIMVKPSLFYMDVIREASTIFNRPLAAYGVSGEYNMIINAVKNGFISESAINEYVTSIFRAGADIFITYFAESLAEGMKGKI